MDSIQSTKNLGSIMSLRPLQPAITSSWTRKKTKSLHYQSHPNLHFNHHILTTKNEPSALLDIFPSCCVSNWPVPLLHLAFLLLTWLRTLCTCVLIVLISQIWGFACSPRHMHAQEVRGSLFPACLTSLYPCPSSGLHMAHGICCQRTWVQCTNNDCGLHHGIILRLL